MKGVSAIIAVILILMIVVALAALAYTWFTGIFTSLTGGAETAVTSTTKAMGTNFRIEQAKNVTPTNVTVVIRNVGTADIDMTKLSAYIDDDKKTIVNQVNLGSLVAGNISSSFNITLATGTESNGRTLKLVTSTGLEQTATIK